MPNKQDFLIPENDLIIICDKDNRRCHDIKLNLNDPSEYDCTPETIHHLDHYVRDKIYKHNKYLVDQLTKIANNLRRWYNFKLKCKYNRPNEADIIWYFGLLQAVKDVHYKYYNQMLPPKYNFFPFERLLEMFYFLFEKLHKQKHPTQIKDRPIKS